jgi:hypothetical protein
MRSTTEVRVPWRSRVPERRDACRRPLTRGFRRRPRRRGDDRRRRASKRRELYCRRRRAIFVARCGGSGHRRGRATTVRKVRGCARGRSPGRARSACGGAVEPRGLAWTAPGLSADRDACPAGAGVHLGSGAVTETVPSGWTEIAVPGPPTPSACADAHMPSRGTSRSRSWRPSPWHSCVHPYHEFNRRSRPGLYCPWRSGRLRKARGRRAAHRPRRSARTRPVEAPHVLVGLGDQPSAELVVCQHADRHRRQRLGVASSEPQSNRLVRHDLAQAARVGDQAAVEAIASSTSARTADRRDHREVHDPVERSTSSPIQPMNVPWLSRPSAVAAHAAPARASRAGDQKRPPTSDHPRGTARARPALRRRAADQQDQLLVGFGEALQCSRASGPPSRAGGPPIDPVRSPRCAPLDRRCRRWVAHVRGAQDHLLGGWPSSARSRGWFADACPPSGGARTGLDRHAKGASKRLAMVPATATASRGRAPRRNRSRRRAPPPAPRMRCLQICTQAMNSPRSAGALAHPVQVTPSTTSSGDRGRA